MYFAENPEEEI